MKSDDKNIKTVTVLPDILGTNNGLYQQQKYKIINLIEWGVNKTKWADILAKRAGPKQIIVGASYIN